MASATRSLILFAFSSDACTGPQAREPCFLTTFLAWGLGLLAVAPVLWGVSWLLPRQRRFRRLRWLLAVAVVFFSLMPLWAFGAALIGAGRASP